MPKIAPSQRVREEIERVLRDGVEGKADVTSTLLRLGAQRLAQELLEEEVTDFLGRSVTSATVEASRIAGTATHLTLWQVRRRPPSIVPAPTRGDVSAPPS